MIYQPRNIYFKAIYSDDWAGIKAAYDAGADLNATNWLGETPDRAAFVAGSPLLNDIKELIKKDKELS